MHSLNVCLNNQILAINTQNAISEYYALISSYTLSNLIADLLQFTGDTVSKVKAGLEKTWDGIKDGAKYLTNFALVAIATSLAVLFNNLISGVFQTTAIMTEFTYQATPTGNQLSFMDFILDLSVVSQDQSIFINTNELSKIFSLTSIFSETLGLGATTAYNVIEQLLVSGITGWLASIFGIALTLSGSGIAFGIPLLITALFSILTHYYTFFYETIHQYNMLTTSADQQEYTTIMSKFLKLLTDVYAFYVAGTRFLKSFPIIITEMGDIAELMLTIGTQLFTLLEFLIMTNPIKFLPRNLANLFYTYMAVLAFALLITSQNSFLFGLLQIIYVILGFSSWGISIWMGGR